MIRQTHNGRYVLEDRILGVTEYFVTGDACLQEYTKRRAKYAELEGPPVGRRHCRSTVAPKLKSKSLDDKFLGRSEAVTDELTDDDVAFLRELIAAAREIEESYHDQDKLDKVLGDLYDGAEDLRS